MDVRWEYEPSDKQKEAHGDPHPELMYGGAMAGGKTYFLCAEAFTLSMEWPGNRIFLGRKVGKHCRETTMVTFDKVVPHIYKENKQFGEISFPNGSVIVYGGLNREDNVDRFKSSEWGAILIDQAEEITEEDYLDMTGRLRWTLPDGRFPHYRLIFTANPRACFLRKHFITMPDKARSRFIQALWSDNPKLPPGYIEGVKAALSKRPELYEALINGNWELLEGADIIIKYGWVSHAPDNSQMNKFWDKRIVACDPSRYGDDETVIYGFNGCHKVEEDIYGEKSTMETAGRCLAMARRMKANTIAVEVNGIGGGIIDRLMELELKKYDGIDVMAIDASAASTSPMYGNVRAEMWFEAADLFSDGFCYFPYDDKLITQLSGIKYRYKSNGRLYAQDKEDIKKELGESPNRGDAFVIGLRAVRRALPAISRPVEVSSSRKWEEERQRELAGESSNTMFDLQ